MYHSRRRCSQFLEFGKGHIDVRCITVLAMLFATDSQCKLPQRMTHRIMPWLFLCEVQLIGWQNQCKSAERLHLAPSSFEGASDSFRALGLREADTTRQAQFQGVPASCRFGVSSLDYLTPVVWACPRSVDLELHSPVEMIGHDWTLLVGAPLSKISQALESKTWAVSKHFVK